MMMTQERKQLAHVLGEIARFEHAAGRPLLPVIVVNKSGIHQGRPGRGFLAAAEGCGALGENEDDATFIKKETAAVFSHWTKWLAEEEPARSF